jgi:protein-tyrosine phosphatase
MLSMTQAAVSHGYIPVIAHVERYECMTKQPERADDLRQMGAWIQLNADAVLGLDGRAPKKFCRILLKNGWADVIASDSHGIKERACHMDKCYEYVAKKYGEREARRLFSDNPEEILASAGSAD